MRRTYQVVVNVEVEAESEEQAADFVREHVAPSGSTVPIEETMEAS